MPENKIDLIRAQQVCLLAGRIAQQSGDPDSLILSMLGSLRQLCDATLACWFVVSQNTKHTHCLLNSIDPAIASNQHLKTSLIQAQVSTSMHPMLLASLNALKHAPHSADPAVGLSPPALKTPSSSAETATTPRISLPTRPADDSSNGVSAEIPMTPPHTYLRRELVPDKEWYAAPLWRKVLSPLGLDDCLLSVFPVRNHTVNYLGLALHRSRNDDPFAWHHGQQFHLLHCAMMPRLYAAWSSRIDQRLAEMRPRLRQTLEALLQGQSEKQIAFKLNLSPHTVHNYVKDLYRRYEVSSRGELLARFIPSASAPNDQQADLYPFPNSVD